MNKSCNASGVCMYRYLGGTALGYGCRYDGYCDYQLPKDSRDVESNSIEGVIQPGLCQQTMVYNLPNDSRDIEEDAIKALKNIISHLQIAQPGLYQQSTVYSIAKRALDRVDECKKKDEK